MLSQRPADKLKQIKTNRKQVTQAFTDHDPFWQQSIIKNNRCILGMQGVFQARCTDIQQPLCLKLQYRTCTESSGALPWETAVGTPSLIENG